MTKHNKLKEGKKSNIKYTTKQLFIIAILIICSITLVSTLGRYVVNSLNNFFFRTKEFYFFSDKLTEKSSYYQIENWTGIDPYTITINMNSRLNNLKASSYDISYDITYSCSSNATCQLSKNSGNILASTNVDYFNLTLTPSTELAVGDKVWVVITATSTVKYKKNISATFVLTVGKEQVSYEIVDSESNKYMDLNITNTLSYYKVKQAFNSYAVGDKINVDDYLALSDENKAKCYSTQITLSFDPKIVVLDMTNENYLKATNVTTTNIDGTSYINGMTFNIEPISSVVVRFYKKDVSKNYTYPITNSTSIITVTSN